MKSIIFAAAAASTLALGGCNSTGTLQFVESHSAVLIAGTCATVNVADGYFQTLRKKGKIGPKTAFIEAGAMIAVRDICANPPIGADGKPDFGKALELILPIYQKVQDLTKSGAP